jgi:nitrogen-specific signal transduction histidine kinase
LIEVDSRHDRTDFRICLPVFPEEREAPAPGRREPGMR